MKQLIIYTKHRRKYLSPGAYGGKLIGLVKKQQQQQDFNYLWAMCVVQPVF